MSNKKESTLTPGQLAEWKTEFTTDPEQLGYAGKSHEEIEQILLTTDRDVNNEWGLTGAQLFVSLDADEYIQISDTNKRVLVSDLIHLSVLDPLSQTVRKVIDHVFGANSKTSKNIDKLRKRKGRRWEEIGLPRPSVSDIADALE